MASISEFNRDLRVLLRILSNEKKALISNNADKIVQLVEKKTEFVDKLDKYKGLDIATDEEAMKLIAEINEIQETNLMLTKQAHSYNEVLMDSIAKNINKNNTYSPYGSSNKSNNVNFIDQSV